MDLVINISVSHGCVDFVQFLAAEIMTDSCVLYTASTIGTVLGSALTRSLFCCVLYLYRDEWVSEMVLYDNCWKRRMMVC